MLVPVYKVAEMGLPQKLMQEFVGKVLAQWTAVENGVLYTIFQETGLQLLFFYQEGPKPIQPTYHQKGKYMISKKIKKVYNIYIYKYHNVPTKSSTSMSSVGRFPNWDRTWYLSFTRCITEALSLVPPHERRAAWGNPFGVNMSRCSLSFQVDWLWLIATWRFVQLWPWVLKVSTNTKRLSWAKPPTAWRGLNPRIKQLFPATVPRRKRFARPSVPVKQRIKELEDGSPRATRMKRAAPKRLFSPEEWSAVQIGDSSNYTKVRVLLGRWTGDIFLGIRIIEMTERVSVSASGRLKRKLFLILFVWICNVLLGPSWVRLLGSISDGSFLDSNFWALEPPEREKTSNFQNIQLPGIPNSAGIVEKAIVFHSCCFVTAKNQDEVGTI